MMLSTGAKRWAIGAVRSSSILTGALFFADGLLANLLGSTTNEDDHFSGMNVEEDYKYSARVAAEYRAGGEVFGKVAEVGPGGNAAVALHLLAGGAQSVDLLDRFSFTHRAENLDRLYRRFDNYNDLKKVRFHIGEYATPERFFADRLDYDGIFSCAVLEHVSDPIQSLAAMIAALKPGGRMVHQVDLRDHGMFSLGGKHELTFLKIPDLIYTPMSRSRGRPNRVRVNDYRRVLENADLSFRILVTHLVGVGALAEPAEFGDVAFDLVDRARRSVAQIQPRLIKRFRELAPDDLVVSGFRIEAQKLPHHHRPDAG